MFPSLIVAFKIFSFVEEVSLHALKNDFPSLLQNFCSGNYSDRLIQSNIFLVKFTSPTVFSKSDIIMSLLPLV